MVSLELFFFEMKLYIIKYVEIFVFCIFNMELRNVV